MSPFVMVIGGEPPPPWVGVWDGTADGVKQSAGANGSAIGLGVVDDTRILLGEQSSYIFHVGTRTGNSIVYGTPVSFGNSVATGFTGLGQLLKLSASKFVYIGLSPDTSSNTQLGIRAYVLNISGTTITPGPVQDLIAPDTDLDAVSSSSDSNVVRAFLSGTDEIVVFTAMGSDGRGGRAWMADVSGDTVSFRDTASPPVIFSDQVLRSLDGTRRGSDDRGVISYLEFNGSNFSYKVRSILRGATYPSAGSSVTLTTSNGGRSLSTIHWSGNKFLNYDAESFEFNIVDLTGSTVTILNTIPYTPSNGIAGGGATSRSISLTKINGSESMLRFTDSVGNGSGVVFNVDIANNNVLNFDPVVDTGQDGANNQDRFTPKINNETLINVNGSGGPFVINRV